MKTHIIRAEAMKAVVRAEVNMSNEAAMRSSAILCANDAHNEFVKGNYSGAYNLAKRSLEYSVGILSPEYHTI